MNRNGFARLLLIVSAVFCSGLITASFVAYSALAADCPSQMISYWRLDETSGTTFADPVGTHDASCTSCPDFDAGRIGGALIFNGVDDGLSVPANADFDWSPGSFSIEFWMKTDGACSGNEVIIGRNDTPAKLQWWVGCYESTGVAAFRLDKNTTKILIYGSTDLRDGRWHHIVAVRDGSAAENRLYVDGTLESSKTIAYSAGFESATAALNIGWLNLDPFYHFAGTIDELAVYGRPLAEKEIRQHYADGSVGLGWGYCPDCAAAVRIMPLGDSITRGSSDVLPDPNTIVGYRQKLYLDLGTAGYNVDFVGSMTDGDAAAPPFDTDHEGHGGWKATDIASNVNSFLSNKPADAILLHIGTNDISSGTQNPENVATILDNIDIYSPDVPVVLARIINRTDSAPKTLATTQFNDAVDTLARARIAGGDKIIIVDQESALNYSTDMADTLHPNATGYEKMSDVWLNALKTFLPICSPVAPFITSPPVITAYQGWQYYYNVNATGNPAPSFNLLSPPQGMTINPVTGIIQWTPSVQGDFGVTVEASNTAGTDTQSFSISVESPPPCPAGVTHYWKLNETGGSSYADFYGGDPATCTDCPMPTTGRVNGAQLFNATSRLSAKDDNTFDWQTGDSFSIELWMKTGSACTGTQVLLGRDDSATSLHWWVGCTSSGYARFYLIDKGGISAGVTASGNVLTDGVWHQIVATRDSAAGTINIYVDGVLKNSTIANYTAGFDSITAPLNIGWLNLAPYFHFTGAIDEVAVYNRVLSAGEIMGHYSAGSSALGYCDNLAPSFVSIPQTNAAVGAPYSYTALAIGNPAPSYSLTAHPAGMTINSSTGQISWTPASNQVGDNNVTVSAQNGSGTDHQDFVVTVTLDTSAYPIRLNAVPYMLLQDAFTAVNADAETLKIRDGEYIFGETAYSKSYTLRLSGGYNSSFSSNGAFTTIDGSLTIQNGDVTVENIIIR